MVYSLGYYVLIGVVSAIRRERLVGGDFGLLGGLLWDIEGGVFSVSR
jgi:hypothetical protein